MAPPKMSLQSSNAVLQQRSSCTDLEMLVVGRRAPGLDDDKPISYVRPL